MMGEKRNKGRKDGRTLKVGYSQSLGQIGANYDHSGFHSLNFAVGNHVLSFFPGTNPGCNTMDTVGCTCRHGDPMTVGFHIERATAHACGFTGTMISIQYISLRMTLPIASNDTVPISV